MQVLHNLTDIMQPNGFFKPVLHAVLCIKIFFQKCAVFEKKDNFTSALLYVKGLYSTDMNQN
jgi:hypothetical protein